MLQNNPFLNLAEVVSPYAMQSFIIAMVVLIAVGTIIQMIIAFVAAIGATISFYWTKFKLLLNKIFKKKKKDHNKIN